MSFGIKHLVVIVAIAAGGFGLAFALSGDTEPTPRTREGAAADEATLSKKGPFARLCRRLQCTPDQIEALLPIIRSYRDDVRADARALAAKRRELARAYKGTDFEGAAELHQEIVQLETRIADRALAAIEAMHPHLTAGQRALTSKLLARHGVEGVLDPPAGKTGKSSAKAKKKRKKQDRAQANAREGGSERTRQAVPAASRRPAPADREREPEPPANGPLPSPFSAPM